MDWDKMKTRFGQDLVKVFLGAAAISAIGWVGYAMLQPASAGETGQGSAGSSAPKPEVMRGVKLLPAPAELSPRTTFRVTFEKNIVAPGRIDQPGQPSPLVFDPEVEGEFIWDSTRSGSFTPASGFPLDARFRVTLRPELAREHGIRLVREYHTPPMQVMDEAMKSLDGDGPFSAALAFNTAMDAKRAKPFVEFHAADGRKMPAIVKPMTRGNRHWLTAPDEPWSMLMAETDERAKGFPTRLVVRPARVLPAGVKWTLVLKKGLPSGDGHQLRRAVSYQLGQREPMALEAVEARNRLNHGRWIDVRFTHALPTDLEGKEFAKWLVLEEAELSLSPIRFEQSELEFSITRSGKNLTLRGPFALSKKYRVRLKPGLPCELGLKTAEETRDVVAFRPVPSRIYLPGYYFSQAVHGNRQFGFVSVNNRAVRLRVKRIAPGQLTKVLDVYQREYLADQRLQWVDHWAWRDGQSLSYELVPGQTVCDRVFQPDAPVDVSVKKEFTWGELLGNNQPGPLFVSVESTGRDGSISRAQVVAQFTDVGLTWKEAAGELHVQAFSLQTAEPLAGATVELVGDGNKAVATARTDASGHAVLPAGKGDDSPGWLVATHKGDRHALGLNRYFSYVRLWPFDIHWGWGDEDKLKTHLFTDRLIYQPGDTVRLKGHVREWGREGLRTPVDLSLPVSASDSRGYEFFTAQATVSEHGSFDLEIPLAKGVSGSHIISVGKAHHFIDVFEYEPATFKLRFPGQRQFAPGEEIRIPVQAGYYFGKPLAGAKVAWTFSGHRGVFAPTGWEKFGFGEADDDHIADLSGEGALSPRGQLIIRPEIGDDSKSPMPLRGRFTVRITDANRQSISGGTGIIRHTSDFYLALRRLPRVRWAGQPLPLQVVAVRPDGTPAPAGQAVTATLKQIDWHSVKMKGAGGTVRYKNEKKVKTIGTAKLKSTTRDADPVPFQLIPPSAGEYRLELRATDANGRPILNATTFYVRGKQPLAWDYRNEFQMELVPDQPVYQAGDTATILLKTPISGRAIVTVEREKVLRSFSVDIAGNAPAIEVPLEEGDAPNVFVSVMLLRGSADSTRKVKAAEYRIGYCELRVESAGSRLKVDTRLSQTDYQPGDEVEATVLVRDHAGAPVPGTEVTLYAVDEGILDLTGYQAPDLHAFFYEPRPLEVDTWTSFGFMRTEDPNRVAFGNKGHLIGDGGSGKLRRKFLAVAFWNATLRTDAEGRIRASFTAPDSLTRYRLFAVAHSGDRFGTAETGFRIHQPLMVESALPRFGRAGDQLIAKAMVYNQTGQAIEAEVKLEVDAAIKAAGKLERRITIPAQGTVAVNFPLEFASFGRARTVWRVHCPAQPKLADARESFIDIRHVAPLRRAVHFARVREAKPNDLLKPLDPALRQAEGKFTVSISTSPMAELATAAEYLLQYPHGCVEQTSSRLLPWLLLDDFEGVFPRFNPKAPKADETIRHGINRLLSMQDHSGGLGYWPGGRATPFASAYGGMALAIAKARGQSLPQHPLDRLTRYLTRIVKEPVEAKAGDEYCLALYTLALLGQPQPASHELAFQARAKLSDSARSLLAMAVAEMEGPEEMINELLKPATRQGRSFGYFGSPGQIRAMRLMALCAHDEEQAGKVAGQIAASARNGHWGSTFGNAWVLYAMSTFTRKNATGSGPAQGTIAWNGQERSYHLDAKQRRAVFTFTNSASREEMPMILRASGKQTLFVQLTAAMRPAASQTKPIRQGLSISRTYTRLKDDGTEDEGAPMRVGDLVRVRLKVDAARAAHYVAIEDGLPASLEPMNTRMRTQRSRANTRVPPWSYLHLSHQLLRKDRAVFYANALPAGTHWFEYHARVRAAGTATAPAAKAEAMYDPEIIGLSASHPIVTLPLDD